MPEPTPSVTGTIVRDAFDSLATSISSEDARNFHSTTLQDVRAAAQAIERQQAQRKSLRNLRRIEPFLRFLESYAPVLEVGCQGFSPMTWVWGPLKLMLQLASQYINIFEKLLEAYAQIAEELPRVDRLQAAFKDNEGFQKTLGLIYVDIIEFHKRAYKFFRRRAWHMFFDSTWRSFQYRFQGILANLRRHTDLLDKEAASIHFLDAKRMVDQTLQDAEDRERQKCASELREVLGWLAPDLNQDQRLDRLSRDCLAETCEWFLRNDVIASWIHEGTSRPVVWLNGIPGSGKSVLCYSLVEYLQARHTTAFASYFCNYCPVGSDTLTLILRTIAAQLIKLNPDLLAYVYQNYVEKALSPNKKIIKNILSEVLASLQSCRILIDGIDECEESQQREILSSILSLQTDAGSSCKLLIASRDEIQINRILRQSKSISLKGKTDNAIDMFIRRGVSDLRQAFDSLDEGFVDRMQRQLSVRAGGMFLWVRLVLDDLQGQTTIQELEDALERLPEGLQEAYNRILERIKTRLSSSQRDQAFRLLRWISCSYRPLKLTELREGTAFRPGNSAPDGRNVILRNVVELCGPLIEELPGGVIDVVHFSAKEYLLDQSSGPFIDRCLAHQQIAFSCISYLNSNLDLIPSTIEEKTQSVLETLIINRYNGLHQYSNKFWIDHVLAYLRAGGKISSCKYLAQAFKQFMTVRRKIEPSSIAISPSGIIPLRQENRGGSDLLVCCEDACLSDMLEQVTRFRKILRTKEYTFESPLLRMKWERDNDPTYLSHIQVRVASVVQDILQIPEAHVPEHITVRALQRFKESYKNFSITCRYSICRYQENVFHSEKDRDTHESTHIRAYKCPDCDFYARGFATKRNLSKHQERYHMHTEDFQLPEQISPGRDLAIAFPGNQALQDYSLQLFLLEKQKQKRLLKEKDSSHGSEQLEALVNQESLVSDTYKMQMPVLEEHDKAAGVNDLLPNEERRKRQQLDPQQQQWTTMSSLDPDVLSQKMDREEEASETASWSSQESNGKDQTITTDVEVHQWIDQNFRSKQGTVGSGDAEDPYRNLPGAPSAEVALQVARAPKPLIPFDDFVETVFLSNPEQFPGCHSNDDLRALATRFWQDITEPEMELWRVGYSQPGQSILDIQASIMRQVEHEINQREVSDHRKKWILLERRLSRVVELVSSLIKIKPDMDINQAIKVAAASEWKTLHHCQHEASYEKGIQHKLRKIEEGAVEDAVPFLNSDFAECSSESDFI